ncbi:hypothetical protein EW145_g482 [Phellinidium pouzarii]|uniref:Uncharacterized protein n=1 Tax=Phellinidium pouzarii TaxID=167371 RepID=A0A4V3XE00_9AGAM|nr:hypothetical protein EW145_g482 [Phellinidium pouzarii]
MPGTFDHNDRPSEVSVMPSPRTLKDRIGPKIEVDDDDMLMYDNENYFGSPMPLAVPYGRRRASAPVQAAATMMAGGSGSVIFPDHSISQRHIRRNRIASETPVPQRDNSRPADRLGGGHGYDGYDSECEDSDDNDSYDGAYPSDGSTIGFASGDHHPDNVSDRSGAMSETGTISERFSSTPSVRSRISSSFSEILRVTGAAPLMGVYEVAEKYVPLVQRRARTAGLHTGVLPGSEHEELDYFTNAIADPSRQMPWREPRNVYVALGRDGEAVRNFISRPSEGIEVDREFSAHVNPPRALPPPRPPLPPTRALSQPESHHGVHTTQTIPEVDVNANALLMMQAFQAVNANRGFCQQVTTAVMAAILVLAFLVFYAILRSDA